MAQIKPQQHNKAAAWAQAGQEDSSGTKTQDEIDSLAASFSKMAPDTVGGTTPPAPEPDTVAELETTNPCCMSCPAEAGSKGCGTEVPRHAVLSCEEAKVALTKCGTTDAPICKETH